jgi:D-alanyl-D-alanine carboxypeptidase
MTEEVGAGASRRLRWAVFGVIVATGITAVGSDPADARSRRKKPSGYNPPYASIVVDANTGAVLQATNADSYRHPASLTKIMTLYLLFERIESGRMKLTTQMPVSAHAAAQSPTKLGLRAGQTLAVEDAILGLVTKSANDAAVVVAEAIGGTESEFARMMTRKARTLGMRRTTYTNASGLPDPDQITTARDQSLLGRAIQQRFPGYYHYFATEAFAYHGRSMRNHNRLLGSVAGVDGIKTGYTRASGFNLVTSMRRGQRHVVAVVLGGKSSRSRDARMRDLLSDHIMTASTRRTAPVLAQAPANRKIQEVAEVEDAIPVPSGRPLSLQKVAAGEATASIEETATAFTATTAPKAGSTDPIKPLLVKTISVKAPPKPVKTASAKFAAISSAAADEAEAPAKIAVVTPKAAQALEKKADSHKSPRSGWKIQVGAFGEEKEALDRLDSAKRRAKKLLGRADPYTETVTKGEKTFYRARFAGLDKDGAEAACRTLKRSDIACLPIKN